MKIVHRIYKGGDLSSITNSGKSFEHEQSNLVDVTYFIENGIIYYICKFVFNDISNKKEKYDDLV